METYLPRFKMAIYTQCLIYIYIPSVYIYTQCLIYIYPVFNNENIDLNYLSQ